MKGGPFKLNSHPKDYFEENPFKSDRGNQLEALVHSCGQWLAVNHHSLSFPSSLAALPPLKEAASSKEKPKPFKPSSPAKKVD